MRNFVLYLILLLPFLKIGTSHASAIEQNNFRPVFSLNQSNDLVLPLNYSENNLLVIIDESDPNTEDDNLQSNTSKKSGKCKFAPQKFDSGFFWTIPFYLGNFSEPKPIQTINNCDLFVDSSPVYLLNSVFRI